MPLYMDIHQLAEGTTPEDVARAHVADVRTQEKYGVAYHRYWINESTGKVFCICDAPNSEAAVRVHREAHGLLAEKIIEVEPAIAEAFLGGGETSPMGAALVPGSTTSTPDPGIRTILFTDIVGSTSLTQSMGDEAAMMMLDLHDTIVRKALSDFSGREVKHTGDGIMASFLSSAAAVRCASQIQRELAKQRETEEQSDGAIKVRIGVAAGEPVEHHEDLFGTTVQLAARLCAHALPEQILVSNAIADLCIGKKLPFQDLGEIRLKGFDQPVRAHTVTWDAEGAAALRHQPTHPVADA